MKDLTDPRSARPAARIQAPAAAFGIDGLVALGVGVTAVACLYFASAVLIPITLAILLSFLVAPLVDSLGAAQARARRVRVRGDADFDVGDRLLGALIATQLTDLAAGMPRYQATIERKMDTVHSLTIGKLNRFASAAGQALQRATIEPPPPEATRSASPPAGARPPSAVPVEVREPVPTPFELAQARVVARHQSAGNRVYRVRRDGRDPVATRRFARPRDPSVRLARPASHDHRDGRSGAGA